MFLVVAYITSNAFSFEKHLSHLPKHFITVPLVIPIPHDQQIALQFIECRKERLFFPLVQLTADQTVFRACLMAKDRAKTKAADAASFEDSEGLRLRAVGIHISAPEQAFRELGFQADAVNQTLHNSLSLPHEIVFTREAVFFGNAFSATKLLSFCTLSWYNMHKGKGNGFSRCGDAPGL